MSGGPNWSELLKGPLGLGLLAAAFLLAAFVVVRLIIARRRPPPKAPVDLAIDLASLGTAGPPAQGPVLECHNVPVRLAALVLAPVGRGVLPPADKLADLLELITPGLGAVLVSHGPQVKRWPPQLSPRGFASTFFANLKLPGDRGKGTPWCAAAGRVEGAEQGLMVGMALRAASINSLGQITVERVQDWLGLLKVKT